MFFYSKINIILYSKLEWKWSHLNVICAKKFLQEKTTLKDTILENMKKYREMRKL